MIDINKINRSIRIINDRFGIITNINPSNIILYTNFIYDFELYRLTQHLAIPLYIESFKVIDNRYLVVNCNMMFRFDSINEAASYDSITSSIVLYIKQPFSYINYIKSFF